MRRIFTFAALLLCINFATTASAQNGNHGHLNAYENKVDQLEGRIDDALIVSMTLNAELNADADPQMLSQLNQELDQAIGRLDSPLNGMTNKANKIGDPELSEETARLALFPSLLQAGSSGSSSNARTASACSDICGMLEEMARITGDDIRVEIQSIRSNF